MNSIIDQIKESYFYYCRNNYKQPKYLLIKSNALYRFNLESIDSEHPNHVYMEHPSLKLMFYGMQIIETNQIDSEFDIA